MATSEQELDWLAEAFAKLDVAALGQSRRLAGMVWTIRMAPLSAADVEAFGQARRLAAWRRAFAAEGDRLLRLSAPARSAAAVRALLAAWTAAWTQIGESFVAAASAVGRAFAEANLDAETRR